MPCLNASSCFAEKFFANDDRKKLLDETDHRKKCVQSLRVTGVGTLVAGLKRIASKGWSCRPDSQK